MKDCESNWVVVSAEFICAMVSFGKPAPGKELDKKTKGKGSE